MMGKEEKDSERSDIRDWAQLPESQLFFDTLKAEISAVQDKICNLNSSGDVLTRDYYRLQGSIVGLERSIDIVDELAKGVI